MARIRYNRERESWMDALRKRLVDDDPRCRRCWQRDGVDMHHKIPVSDPDCPLYDESNLILLCAQCHMEVHRGQPGMGHNIHNLMSPKVLNKKVRNLRIAQRKLAQARYKEVRRMHEDEGMSFKAIGKALGKTQQAVWMIYRAKGTGTYKTRGPRAKMSGRALMMVREVRRLKERGIPYSRISSLTGVKSIGQISMFTKPGDRGDDIIKRNAPKNPTIHIPPAEFWQAA